MRFLITTLVFGLASIAQAGTYGKQDDGKATVKFSYEWWMSVTDENLGRDTEDDEDFKVRAIENNADAEIDFSKEWGGVKVDVSYNLLNGLETAVASAELPRSYLNVAFGKGWLNAGGWQEYSSPYLSYHNPFPTYGPMVRIFAPIGGFGELSLMITNDVMKGDDDKRWFNDDKSAVGMWQYKGEFGIVSPLVQFAMYDFKYSSDDDNGGNGWQSWLLTAGVKLALHNLTLHLDYIHDNRKNPPVDKDGEEQDSSTTVLRNYTAGVFYQHGMVMPWASLSVLMTANDDDRYEGIDGNYMTPADDGEGYGEALKKKFGVESYDDLKSYHKYSTNMMVFEVGTYVKCIEDKLKPYISYRMKSHKLDPDWDEEDSDTETQLSHSITFGIEGVI